MNNKIVTVIVAIILMGASFYGGIKYSQSNTPARGNLAGFPGSQNVATGTRNGRGFGAGGGAVIGDIISKDSGSITVKLADGSTKIVLVPASASVMKMVIGSDADLSVGKSIVANGTANSDGSITAMTIQLRTSTTTATR